MPEEIKSGRIVIHANLTWHGAPLCQACGATLDTRTPDIIEFLDGHTWPMYFIPICKDCCEQGAKNPDHAPLASSIPPANYGKKARYNG